MKKQILFLIFIFTTSGCGADNVGDSADTYEGDGVVAVNVLGAKAFNPHAEHGRIKNYAVEIRGPNITTPIVANFAGDKTEGVVEGVPTGTGRIVSVTASNSNEIVVRSGEAVGVSVGEGVTSVDVRLKSVPIFTNIFNNSVIDNTRLAFHLFSDPAHRLSVQDITDTSEMVLTDTNTTFTEISMDENEGTGRMVPALLSEGKHKFVVCDLVSGLSSEVNVKLLDGTKRRSAPLFAAGSANLKKLSRSAYVGTFIKKKK